MANNGVKTRVFFEDQLNRKVEISLPVKKIVSVVPSQTELLYDLGLDREVVGQTVFCIHPENQFKKTKKIGGTKKLKLNEILSLKPDLIVANKEENDRDQLLELSKQFPVWISDIYTLKDAFSMIQSLGSILEREAATYNLLSIIKTEFAKCKVLKTAAIKPKVLYLIWNNPIMAAGRSTFINAMLEEAGFENVLRDPALRYPKLTENDITTINPDLILLSSEPFPFANEHMNVFKGLITSGKVQLVDGEMFSWYGSRLKYAPEYFLKIR